VTTVSGETGETWTGATLREVMALGFSEAFGVDLEESEPSAAELACTASLVEKKYSTEGWLFGRGPQSDATATALIKTPSGLLRLYVALQGDIIKSALFTGDFNQMPEPISRFESALKWARAEAGELERIAAGCFPNGTGLEVEAEVLTAAILDAAAKSADHRLAAPDRSGSCYFPEEKR
jgi:hypothetical protein